MAGEEKAGNGRPYDIMAEENEYFGIRCHDIHQLGQGQHVATS